MIYVIMFLLAQIVTLLLFLIIFMVGGADDNYE